MNPLGFKQQINLEINVIKNSISCSSALEIDWKIQILIKRIEENENLVDYDIKENLCKLEQTLIEIHHKTLTPIISKLSNFLFKTQIAQHQTFALTQKSPSNSLVTSQQQDEEECKVSMSEVVIHLDDLSSIPHVGKESLSKQQEEESHARAYASLTRRLSPALQQKIAEIVEQQKGIEIMTLCQAAREGNFDHPIFHKDNINVFPVLALTAFKERNLSIEVFSSVMIYWSILKYHDRTGIQVIQLFNQDGSINQGAKAMLQTTMAFNYEYNPELPSFKSNILTEEQFSQFYAELKKLSPSQQQFWIVQDLQKSLHEGPVEDREESFLRIANGLTSISQVISETIGINTFSRIQDSLRIIPNLSMVQAFLNAKYETPIQLEPIIGFGNIEDLRINGLTHTRIVSLAFPLEGFCDFDRADGYKVLEDYDMLYHDAVYHGDVVSAIPPSDQQAFVFLAEALQEASKHPRYCENEFIKVASGKFYNRLIDMEFPIYRADIDMDSIFCFYATLVGTVVSSTLQRFTTQAMVVKREKTGRDLTREEVAKVLEESEIKGLEFPNLFLNKEFMGEVGRIFVEKISCTMTPVDLQSMSTNLADLIDQDRRFLTELLGTSDYISFPEAIVNALERERSVYSSGQMKSVIKQRQSPGVESIKNDPIL